jgi:hypothetical protein
MPELTEYESYPFMCASKHEHGALRTVTEMVLSESKGDLARAKRGLDRVMALKSAEVGTSPRHQR